MNKSLYNIHRLVQTFSGKPISPIGRCNFVIIIEGTHKYVVNCLFFEILVNNQINVIKINGVHSDSPEVCEPLWE